MRQKRLLPATLLLLVACGNPSPTQPTSDVPRLPPIETPPLPLDVSPTIRGMLGRLALTIVSSYRETQDLLPRNPQYAAFYEQKMKMLATPGLIDEIVADRRWGEVEAMTIHGGVPIGGIFPLESMRGECGDALRVLAESLPFLVEFMGEPFLGERLEVWYGFLLSGTGGSGQIRITDRSTSDAANTGTLPYDAVLIHEASHSYISNEALNQFLELYVYNMWRGRGPDPLNWELTRGWSPTTPSPFGVNGVMDVYAVVGHDAIRRAYRAIAPLRPAYGRPLADAVIAAFVAEMPAEHRAFVEQRLRTIVA